MADVSDTTSLERTSLEAHVDLCAMRYGQLDSRLISLESKMDSIQRDLAESHKSMKTTVIGSAATIVSGLLALALTLYLN